jgi:adenylate kinase family enzyme
LDIKFWIQEQTFERLDHELKSAGNVRTASVRSDLLLHLPRILKTSWGVDDDYIVFVGEQLGTIVDEEMRFDANLVFPWLDDRSFNKWFQPDGHDRPFGSLEIMDADKVDFRRKSFEKMFNFLDSKRYLTRPAKQLEIPLEQEPNLILCGYTCAGKTTASQHLARKFGYLHIEASDFMYLSYFYRHGYQGPVPIGDFAEQALTVRPHIAAERISEYLEDNVSTPTVISGFRSPDEIEFLTATLAPFGRRFQTIFITADECTRFNRLAARMRPGDDMTVEAFRERDEQQRRMGLELIRCSKRTKLISNKGTLADYLDSIDSMVGMASRGEIDLALALARAAAVKEVKLEDAILIALLTVSSDDEAHPFLSTTQIAGEIRQVFPNIQPKHKDSVSRYFNQDFYAYYEIATPSSSRSGKRTYRLSNTGYGRAVRALRDLV